MVNIGSPEDGVASIIRENRGVNGSALRKLLIVKEEGQSAMHYVRCSSHTFHYYDVISTQLCHSSNSVIALVADSLVLSTVL